METIGMMCMGIGFIIAAIFGIQLLILAFRESTLWFLAYFFIPFAPVVFIVKYWDQAKKPFLRSLLAIPFYIAGFMLMPPA